MNTLRKSGTKRNFLNFIKFICKKKKKSSANTLNECFPLGMGTGQGCPFSARLFTTAAEILACEKNKSKKRKKRHTDKEGIQPFLVTDGIHAELLKLMSLARKHDTNMTL